MPLDVTAPTVDRRIVLVWRADYVPPAARAFLGADRSDRPANLCGIEGSQAPPHEESVDIRAIAKRAGFFVIVLVAAVVLILSLPGISGDPRPLLVRRPVVARRRRASAA